MIDWTHFRMVECYPNCSCELPSELWMDQTTAFWSSMAYFVGALLLYWQVRKRTLKFEFWTFAVIVLSISSFIFHSTYTMVAVALDYASIALILSFFLMLKVFRKWRFRPAGIELAFAGYYLLLWAAFNFLPMWWRVSLCVFIFIVSMREISRSINKRFWDHPDLTWSVATLILVFVAFVLEELRIWCHPNDLFHGHTLWHLGSAISLYLYGRWRFKSHLGIYSNV